MVSARWRRIAESRRTSRRTSSTQRGSRATLSTSPATRLMATPIDGAAARAVTLARGNGARVSVDLSAWTRIREYGPERFREQLERLRPTSLRQRGRSGEIVGAATGCADRRRQARRPRLARPRRGASSYQRETSRSSTLRVRAMRSRRVFSSAGRSLRSRPQPAVSPGWGRCRDRRCADEVREACRRRSVVALETTLVAHGFPPGRALPSGWSQSAAFARRARAGDGRRARRRSASACQRKSSARFDGSARKVGPRDLAACVAQGAVGATTVGGTLAVCRAAGIRFMGTGGIGGVHRGFPDPPDVSADLGELAVRRRSSSPRG